MPIARTAYGELELQGKLDPERHSCAWTTQITPRYAKWASERVRTQIQQAGFRLAALLVAIFEP